METTRCKFWASVLFLQRVLDQYKIDIKYRHKQKLESLYGAPIFMPTQTSKIMNLSTHNLSEDERALLEKGLNFSAHKDSSKLKTKISVEKLYSNINHKDASKQIQIENTDELKAKLACFGAKNKPLKAEDNLSKTDKAAVKSLMTNKNIVISRPDKGGGVVIMNSSDYYGKLNLLLQDETKFIETNKNQSEKIKTKINDCLNRSGLEKIDKDLYMALKRVGDFQNGHLYGTPKIHKNLKDPPLRPIVSHINTATHGAVSYTHLTLPTNREV